MFSVLSTRAPAYKTWSSAEVVGQMIRDEVKSNTHTRAKSAYIAFLSTLIGRWWKVVYFWDQDPLNKYAKKKTWLLNRQFGNCSTFFFEIFFFSYSVLIYLFLSVCTSERVGSFVTWFPSARFRCLVFQNQPTSLLFIPFSSSIFPSSFTDFFSHFLLEVIPNRWLILPNGSGIITHKTQ